MTEWSVDIEAVCHARLDEDFADSVLEELARYAPALSFAANRLDVRFSVDASSASDAFAQALKLFDKALPGAETVRAEIETAEELDRALAASNVPELVGVAELADLLNVSRQRASELARSREFPKPWVVLKAGPVWKRSSIARFAGHWSRQPGRPRRTVTV
jgi:hypothetical protein